jgi:hypothetical protein
MIENRKTYRLPLRTKFVFSDSRTVMVGNSVNISEGGIFISTVETPTVARETRCRCLFLMHGNDTPISTEAIVKRVIAASPNPEEVPGVGFSFVHEDTEAAERIQDFIAEMRRNFEVAATVLSAGEPEVATLAPLVSQMHLPPYSDLGELKLIIERVLRSIELVERQNSGVSPQL